VPGYPRPYYWHYFPVRGRFYDTYAPKDKIVKDWRIVEVK
jgi:hypothetical protein